MLPSTTQKHPQTASGSKKTLEHCLGHEKTKFWRPGPPSWTPKVLQIRVQKRPRKPKIRNLYFMGRNINFDFGLEVPKEGFGIQNEALLNTFGNRNTSVSPSLIFEGCTIRFACFYTQRPVVSAVRNAPKECFFRSCANTLSETAKRAPRTLQNMLQNSTLDPSEAPRGDLLNLIPQKVTFCAGSPQGDL